MRFFRLKFELAEREATNLPYIFTCKLKIYEDGNTISVIVTDPLPIGALLPKFYITRCD